MWRTFLFLCVALIQLAGAVESFAAKEPRPGPNGTYVERFLKPYMLPHLDPEADRFGEVEGNPPAIPLYKGDELLGYAFDTWDVVQAVGFSRKPFHLLAAVDLDGRLTGTRIAWHVEPIALLGLSGASFAKFLTQFAGHDVRNGVRVLIDGEGRAGVSLTAEGEIDGVSRVTISSMLFAEAIIRSARIVADARGIEVTARGSGKRLDVERFQEQSWPEMVDDGSLAVARVSHADIAQVYAEGAGIEAPAAFNPDDPDGMFLELWTGLVNPAGIGANLLGRRGFRQYAVGRGLADSAIFVASRGAYPMLADDEAGGLPALQVVQGARTIRLRPDRFRLVRYFDIKDRPEGAVQGMFQIAASEGFDPTLPWRLELAVEGASGQATPIVVSLDYALPAHYLIEEGPGEGGAAAPAAPPTATVSLRTPEDAAADPDLSDAPFDAASATGPNWRAQWQQQRQALILLAISLAALLLILSAQEAIVRRPRLHVALRVGFLVWTVVWIGWIASAQLSVIHLLNWAQSFREGVDWAFFLMEPLIFLITAFVVISVLLWGRAAFCGWLCPFGALQELLNRFAVFLRVPQFEIPAAIDERLKAVKYLIFIGLFGLTFYAVELAYTASVVEPFKAAITFRFDAPWPAVLYAVVLLAIGLIVERFYCRFICPLGAGLAILGRFRMFDWLKRRAECGSPCSRCEQVCPVRAIRADGTIDMNECFYCLDCQVVYYDAHQCPPLIKRRKRREAAGPDLVHVIEPATAPDR